MHACCHAGLCNSDGPMLLPELDSMSFRKAASSRQSHEHAAGPRSYRCPSSVPQSTASTLPGPSTLFLQLFSPSRRRETDKRKAQLGAPDRTSQPCGVVVPGVAWRGARPGTNATVRAGVRACGAPLQPHAHVQGHRAPMFPTPCREETPPQMPGRHGRVAMQCKCGACVQMFNDDHPCCISICSCESLTTCKNYYRHYCVDLEPDQPILLVVRAGTCRKHACI
jgi:hypothetical protein